MTTTLRETDNYKYIQDLFHKHTAIFDRRIPFITDWNTGYEAEDEKIFLVSCTDEEFELYCSELINN
jgi:hypothetical protein